MASLKPNDQIVAEFVVPFTLALKKWAHMHNGPRAISNHNVFQA